jgi:hypothetical protein
MMVFRTNDVEYLDSVTIELIITYISPYATPLIIPTEKRKAIINSIESKGKAVQQHTYGGTEGRGGIAPTHSRPRH